MAETKRAELGIQGTQRAMGLDVRRDPLVLQPRS